MKKIFAVFILLILVFSGCSSGTSFISKDKNSEKVDITGYGLEVDFSVDTKYIDKNKVLYTLKLKNTGLKEVVITRSNFKIETAERYTGFTTESINEMYTKIFASSDSLVLVNDQEKTISGILILNENYKNYAIDKLNYELEVKYNYQTIFDNNLEFVYNNGIYELKKLDKVSQAAPLQISDIKLIPDMKTNEYILEYYFDDRGKGYFESDDTQVKIENLKIQLGTNDITYSCVGSQKEAGKEKMSLDLTNLVVRRDLDLVLECKTTLDKTESFTTKTFGEFFYEYKIKKKGTISIPRE